MKYIIKDGDKKWSAVSYIEQKCDVIKVDTFNGNSEGFLVGTNDFELIGWLYTTMIGVSDSFKVS